MFYRIDEKNNIIDSADFKYADDCLQTDKNIIRGFNGKLVFEEETQTKTYLKEKQEFESIMSNESRIAELKVLLLSTDYKAIKYAEGVLTEEEYLPIKEQRELWRDEINELEVLLDKEVD